MKVIFMIFNFLFLISIIKSNDEQPTDGPASIVVEKLALHTVKKTDEIQNDIITLKERSGADLLGNNEVITASAMELLGQAIFEASSKLSNCPQNWTVADLFELIDDKLTKCTTNLLNLRTIFQGESQALLQNLQAYVSQLSNLPAQCALLNGSGSISSSTACFVQLLTELNRNVSHLLTEANATLVRTRQSTRSGVMEATACSTKVVNEIVKFLNETFENC